MDKLLLESGAEFRKIATLLDRAVGDKPYGPTYDAYILAWRMYSRIEEMQLRHPVI